MTKRTAIAESPPVVASPMVVASPSAAMMARRYPAEVRVLAILLVIFMIAGFLSIGRGKSDTAVFLPGAALGSSSFGVEPTRPATIAAAAPVTPVAAPAAPAAAPSIVVIPMPVPSFAAPPAAAARPAPVVAAAPQPVRAQNGSKPPVVRITAVSPRQPQPGQGVELRFQAGDTDGVIGGWNIDWGDGSESRDIYDQRCAPDAPPGEPDHEFPAQRHTYRELGTYKITVLVISVGTCGLGPSQRATQEHNLNVTYLPAV